MAKRKYYRKIHLFGGQFSFKIFSGKKRKKSGFIKNLVKFPMSLPGWHRLKLAAKILGFLFLALLFGAIFLVIYYGKDLPRPESFTEKPYIQATKIYDRTGEILLYKIYGEEKRTVVNIEKIPLCLQQAVIVAEDANFYQHSGLDLKAIARAIMFDLKSLEPTQGGSTITQQLIRSSFLTNEKTLNRKIKEIILSLELEKKYSKQQILEWYLNQVPFGSNAYGVEEASQTYFQKSVSEISIPEAAYLAALIKAPSYLSPYGSHKDQLSARKDYILNRMAEKGYLTPEQAQAFKEEEVKFAEIRQPIKAPHFVMYVKDYLEEKYGENFLKEKGLKVYTTLDWDLQEYAEKIVKDQAKINEKFHAYNAALIIISPKDGHILAMVGSKDFFASSYPENCRPGKDCLFEPYFNVAAPPGNMGRQPGSAFKPFAYATAFKKGYTPNTLVWDVRTNFGTWGGQEYIPKNYDNKFRGLVSFRQGLAQSLNIPSVKVLYLAGIEDTIKTARDLGITTLTQDLSEFGLSLVLGGKEVKLIDLASSYGVFANDGVKISPSAILKIEDVDGNIIEENQKSPQRVLDAQTARLINSVLSDYEIKKPVFGSHSSVFFDEYKVAAKTGTTQYYNNFWLMGYTPETVVGVWVGNNNNSDMDHIHGTQLTGPIFHQVMEKCLSVYPPKEAFQSPAPVISQNPILDGQSLSAHSILYYVQRDNPNQKPDQPWMDPQYLNWETGVEEYLTATNTPKTNLPSDLPLE